MQNKIEKKWSTKIFDETEMLQLGEQLAKNTKEGLIVFLYGDLGAGKTTLTRGFLRGLGVTEKVKSPTYTLVESYQINHHLIFHFDFYRIHSLDELKYLGLEDYFSSTAICLIEWPERGLSLLPEPDLACYIAIKDFGREVTMIAHSVRGEEVASKVFYHGDAP